MENTESKETSETQIFDEDSSEGKVMDTIGKAAADIGDKIKSGASTAKKVIGEKFGQVKGKIDEKITQVKDKKESSKLFEAQAGAYGTAGGKTVLAIEDCKAMTLTFLKSDAELITDGSELNRDGNVYALYRIDKDNPFKFEAEGKEYELECIRCKYKDAGAVKALNGISSALAMYKPGLFGKGKYAEAQQLFGEFRISIENGRALEAASYERLGKLLTPMLSPELVSSFSALQSKYAVK